jgi:hypothetical protein
MSCNHFYQRLLNVPQTWLTKTERRVGIGFTVEFMEIATETFSLLGGGILQLQ